jgi:Mn2+/Fe2+ NRAMP family transporter
VKRLLSILLWSVISAAFIGPGTVTTCSAAGASYGLSLLWALLFSTLACLTLQEAAARIPVVSGLDLGQALRHRARSRRSGGVGIALVLGAVVLGCAAYEAGNILGAVAGASLQVGMPWRGLTLLVGATAGLMLWFARAKTVARALGVVVAVMGVAFLATAISMGPAVSDVARGLLRPSFPQGSGLLIVGLIGTTVVPYNLFLGSGLAHGHTLGDTRFGLAVAIGLGGLISMAVLVAGTAVEGPFGFATFGEALSARLGSWATALFAVGLLAAGLSSAMTAPLAAAVTARSLLGDGGEDRWSERSWRYRGVWLFVLATGIGFGLADVRPVPVILLAQALNGVLLPFVAVFLFILVNDRKLLGKTGINGWVANTAFAVTVAVTVMIGSGAVLRALATAVGRSAPAPDSLVAATVVIAVTLGVLILARVRRARRG